MTISVINTVQRFYPEFFLRALQSGNYLTNGSNQCKIAIFGTGAVFDNSHYDLSNVENYIIANSTQDININVTRSGYKINFSIPEISWTGLTSSPFRHIIVWKVGDPLKEEYNLFSHFDLGDEFSSQNGEFVFSPNASCIPNINLNQRACA